MTALFSLRTVRKKLLMLTKLAGGALLLSYLLCAGLPVSREASLLIWLGFLLALVLGLDFFMARFITRPVAELNASARRMAGLDFSAPCAVSSSDEFGELAGSLNAMSGNLQQALARLEAALAGRRELADSLSHEMKTPLGVIRAYAEGLLDETDEAKQRRYAQVIISEAERMNGLIVRLLDLSALESGAAPLEVTRFDLVELVETAAGRLLIDTPGGDFDLQYQLPEAKVFVRTDRRRMELTANGGTLDFSIFNQGRPIPEDELPSVWTKFYRGSGASYDGSGLGLAIAAQILSMQNLPYGAENRADGVRFHFSIPIAE